MGNDARHIEAVERISLIWIDQMERPSRIDDLSDLPS
jgi:hypothetical protein